MATLFYNLGQPWSDAMPGDFWQDRDDEWYYRKGTFNEPEWDNLGYDVSIGYEHAGHIYDGHTWVIPKPKSPNPDYYGDF